MSTFFAPTAPTLPFAPRTRRPRIDLYQPPPALELPTFGRPAQAPAPFPQAPTNPFAPNPFNQGGMTSSDRSNPFAPPSPDQGIERRGQHPLFRQLVDDGPEAIEESLRQFLRDAPPEAVSENPRALWQTALEIIDLPRNLIANLVFHKMLGVKPTSKEEFAGLRKVYGADVLRSMGWKPDSIIGKVGQFLAGLAIDFITDPLSWITLGAGGGAKTLARTASELALDISRAKIAGRGLSIAKVLDPAGNIIQKAVNVGRDHLDELVSLTKAVEEAEAAGSLSGPLSAVQRAAGQLPAKATHSGRFGLGIGTRQMRETPIGHVLFGPVVIGGKATAKVLEYGPKVAGNLAEAVGSGKVVGGAIRTMGKPIEYAGKGLNWVVDKLGAASDFVGTPGRFLPKAEKFIPYRDIPGVGRGIKAAEKFMRTSTGRKVGDAAGAGWDVVKDVAGKIGIIKTPLQQLVERFRHQAEAAVRMDEKTFAKEFAPLIQQAAKDIGIAPDHLEPVWSVLAETLPQIQAAAEQGDGRLLRSLLEEQEQTIKQILGKNYAPAKVTKITDEIIDGLSERGAEPPDAPPAVTREPTPSGDRGGAAAIPANVPDNVVDLGLPGTNSGKHSQDYTHGIQGSEHHAKNYVDKTVGEKQIEIIRKALKLQDQNENIVWAPIPSTSGNGNQVPLALARKLAKTLGGEVREDLLAAGTFLKRRNKSVIDNLGNRRDLVVGDTELPAGSRIIIVDDTMKTGGTLQDAAINLQQAGHTVDGYVVGKAGKHKRIKPESFQLDELRRQAGHHILSLERSIGRSAEQWTASEVEAIRSALGKGKTAQDIARQILRNGQDRRGAPGVGRPLSRPGSRKNVEQQLIDVHDDLVTQEMIDTIETRNAMTEAQTGIETPHAAGYTFTEAMTGEARQLKETLEGRGYKHLTKMVKVRKKGQKVVAGETGDEALNNLMANRQAGHDPLEQMADAIIQAHNEARQSNQPKIERAIEWIEENPAMATAEQKFAVQQYHALTDSDKSVRKRARNKQGELIDHDDLEVGDRVEIAGDQFTVESKDPEHGVRLQDGIAVDLQPGEPVMVDAATHAPDPVKTLVTEGIASIRTSGRAPTKQRIWRFINEHLQSDPAGRDSATRTLFGIEKIKGNKPLMEKMVERALLQLGEGSRGANWENILKRLEDIEKGRPGGLLNKFETKSHPLGNLIEYIANPSAGGRLDPRLTEQGRDTLKAMRGYLQSGGSPEHITRLIDDLNRLGPQLMAARRTGKPNPPGTWRQFTQKKQVLKRLGNTIDDDPAWWAAHVERRTAEALPPEQQAALAIPQPDDLFAPSVSAVVKKMLQIERDTRIGEAIKGVNAADLSTERGIGYFPRIMGNAKTVVGKMQRRWGIKWEEEFRRVAENADRGTSKVLAGLSPAEQVRAIIKAENRRRIKAGMKAIPELADSSDQAELIRSIAVVLDNNPDIMPSHRHQLMRTFARESMVHEINQVAEFTGVGFMTDPVAVWLKRRYASHFATAGADFLREAIKDAVASGLAVPIKGRGATPDGYARLTDKRFGAIASGYAFKDELVKEFKRFTGTMDKPHVVLRAYDWATSHFKTLVLAAVPYTTTNLMSGVFQANQFNAFSHQAWSGAMTFMEDLHHGRNLDKPMRSYVKGLPKNVAKMTVQEFYDLLSIEHGALGGGYYGMEMETLVAQGYKTGWSITEGFQDGTWWGMIRDDRGRRRFSLADQKLFKAFRAFNVGVEDWMKTGFILERLRKGDDLVSALDHAKRALNQSADMTEFEKATMRRMMPFWGWMKGNAVLQMSMAAARPQMTALVPKIRGNLEAAFAGEEQLPPSLRPRHVAGEFGVQLTGGPDAQFVNLTRIFPVKELGTTPLAGLNAPGAVVDAFISGLNPLIKAPIEASLNRDFFWDRPIDEYAEQEKTFLGVPMSPSMKRIARMARPLNVIEQQMWRGMPATAAETGGAIGQAVGLRAFSVDTKRQILERQRELSTQISAVMRDFARARMKAEKAGRDWRSDANVQRMADIYARLIEKRDALPLSAIRESDRDYLRDRRDQRKELKQFAIGA